MADQQKSVVTNFDLIGCLGDDRELYAFTTVAQDWKSYLRQCANADLVIIDNDAGKVYLACVMRLFCRFRLVSVDILLRPPQDLKSWLLCFLKRALLTRVDKFILYFKNTAGYQHYYGINQAKIDYVPFKVNGVEESYFPRANPDGDYVLCAGRTLRDLKTFVVA